MHKTLIDSWWLIILRGIVTLLFGLILIASPVKTVTVVTALIGLLMLIEGILGSLMSFFTIGKTDKWWLLLLQGVFSILIGLAVFNYPGITVAVLFFLFSMWLIVIGIVMIVIAIIVRKETEIEWFLAGTGIVSLIIGILLINNPSSSFSIIAMLAGIYALISGTMITAFGFKLRSLQSRVKKLEK